MTAKEYLSQYRSTVWRVARLEERIEIQRALAERTSAVLLMTPRSGDNRTRDDVWARLVDTKEEYKAELNALIDLQLEIEAFIREVPGELNQTVLQLRFIDLMPIAELAEMLDCDIRSVYRYLNKALDAADAVMPANVEISTF